MSLLSMVRNRGRWFFIFHAVLTSLLVYPLLEMLNVPHPARGQELVNVIILLSVIYISGANRKQFIISLALALLSVFSAWFSFLPDQHLISIGFTLLLYLYALVILLYYLLNRELIDSNEIYGSLIFYLFLGFTWAHVFYGLEIFSPGSFHIETILNIDKLLILLFPLHIVASSNWNLECT